MAAFGRHAAAMPPDYRHPASCLVPLAFPFALDGAKVDRVPLAPPSLDGLELLRGEAGLSARTILVVTTPLTPRAVGALRWPDVEALLAAALDLLPPDLVASMRGEVEAEEPASSPADPTTESMDPPTAETPAAFDVSDQLGLDPGDFTQTI